MTRQVPFSNFLPTSAPAGVFFVLFQVFHFQKFCPMCPTFARRPAPDVCPTVPDVARRLPDSKKLARAFFSISKFGFQLEKIEKWKFVLGGGGNKTPPPPQKNVKIGISNTPQKKRKKAKAGFGVKIGPLRHPPLAGGGAPGSWMGLPMPWAENWQFKTSKRRQKQSGPLKHPPPWMGCIANFVVCLKLGREGVIRTCMFAVSP